MFSLGYEDPVIKVRQKNLFQASHSKMFLLGLWRSCYLGQTKKICFKFHSPKCFSLGYEDPVIKARQKKHVSGFTFQNVSPWQNKDPNIKDQDSISNDLKSVFIQIIFLI